MEENEEKKIDIEDIKLTIQKVNKFTDKYHGVLALIMLAAFLSLMWILWSNAETLKTHPCQVCVEKSNMICTSKDSIQRMVLDYQADADNISKVIEDRKTKIISAIK